MIHLLLVYFIFGVEWALAFYIVNVPLAYLLCKYVTKRYYTPRLDDNNVNIHSKYPSFHRMDKAPSFLRILFGLVSFVYIKLFLFVLFLLVGYVRMKLNVKGKSDEIYKSPDFIEFMKIGQHLGGMLCKVIGIINPQNVYKKEEAIRVYKKYLGPDFDYDKEMKSNDYATIVSNHVGWIDIFYLCYITGSSFVAKISVKKVPIIGTMCQLIGTVFIDRGGDKEGRDKAIKSIEARQIMAFKKETISKVVIFPEGTGTNNTGLINFKKGAFGSLLPVKPYLILVNGNGEVGNLNSRKTDDFSLGAGVMSTETHIILSMCYLYFDDFFVLDLPVFTPNDFMYENFKELGKSKADIYTEVVRNVMSEVSGLPKHDKEAYDQKLEYLCHVKGRKIKST